MRHPQADELYERYVSSPEFAQLCKEACDRSRGKKGSSYTYVRRKLNKLLGDHQDHLGQQAFQRLFQRLYISLMKVVSQQTKISFTGVFDASQHFGAPQRAENIVAQLFAPKPSNDLFPQLDQQMTPPAPSFIDQTYYSDTEEPLTPPDFTSVSFEHNLSSPHNGHNQPSLIDEILAEGHHEYDVTANEFNPENADLHPSPADMALAMDPSIPDYRYASVEIEVPDPLSSEDLDENPITLHVDAPQLDPSSQQTLNALADKLDEEAYRSQNQLPEMPPQQAPPPSGLAQSLPIGLIPSPAGYSTSGSYPQYPSPLPMNAGVPDLSKIKNKNSRFETVSFPEGFYLLDQKTGASWFISAGSHQFVACQFETAPQPAHNPSPLPNDSTTSLDNGPQHPSPMPLFSSPSASSSSLNAILSTSPMPKMSAKSTMQINQNSSDDILPTELFPTLVPPKYLDIQKKPSSSYPTHASQPFDQEVLQNFPYPIARLFDAFLVESDPRIRLRLLLLVFNLVLKYSTFPLIVQYLKSSHLNDVSAYYALQRLQSSQLSTWLEFARHAFNLLQNDPPPFAAKALHTFSKLEFERLPQERFLYTQRFLDPLGKERSSHLQLGLLEALVVYRDSFVHGFNPTLEQAQEDLVVYEPLLREILQEMTWVVDYPLLYTFRKQEDGTYLTYPLMGMYPEQTTPIELPAHPDLPTTNPLFLYDPDHPETPLSLYPLLITALPLVDDSPIPSQRHALFFFNDCSSEKINYHNLWQYPYSTDESVEYWQTALAQKSISPASSGLSEAGLFEYSEFWTKRNLEHLIHGQQYLPELTIPRRAAQRPLLDFYASRFLGMIILGASGIGKTSFLAAEAERRLTQQQPVLLLNGHDLSSSSIQEKFAQIFGFSDVHPNPTFEDIIQHFPPYLTQEKPLLIFFDAIEEHEHPEEFFYQLDEFVLSIAQGPLCERVKLVLSLRSDFYHSLRHKGPLFPQSQHYFFSFEDPRLGFRPSSITLELPPFQLDELEVAYQRYRDFHSDHGIAPFSPRTNWQQLPQHSRTRTLLRHPLYLRLALATFCQQDLPEDLTLEELLHRFLEQVIEEKHSPLPVPERLQFLRAMTKIFDEHGRNTLSKEVLYFSDVPQLSRAVQNAHTDSPYIQLLHLGIILEEWHPRVCLVRFTAETLFHFFLTRHWLQQNGHLTLPELLDALKHSDLPNLYFFAWLHILEQSNENASELVRWIYKNINETSPFLKSFLTQIIQSNDPKQHIFLQELLLQADEAILFDVLTVVDQLLNSGFEESASQLLDAILTYSTGPQVNPLRSEILFRQARIAELHGDVEHAMLLFKHSRTEAELHDLPRLLTHAFLRLASLYRAHNDISSSAEVLHEALIHLDGTRHGSLKARVLRQQGNLSYEQGELNEALSSYEESLHLDEEADYARGIAASLSNLGTVLGSRGDLDGALEHYHRCMRIQQSLGDRKNVATTLNNIGIILKNQGKTSKALQHFQRSLKLREEIGHFKEIVTSHNNIALMLKQQGDLQGALEHQRQSLLIKSRLQDSRGIASGLQHIGDLLYHLGELDEALQHYQQSCDLFEQLGELDGWASTLLSLGQIWEEKGQLTEALPYYQQAQQHYQQENDTEHLAVSMRMFGRLKAQQGELNEALQEVHKGLALAESEGKRKEVLQCMLELAQIRLLRHELPATRAYIDRALSLSEEIEAETCRKDALCLLVRVAIRVENWLEVEENLQQLENMLEELSFDPTPHHTVWALFEAAQFYQDLDHTRALGLSDLAIQKMGSRHFIKRQELEELYLELQNTPHTPHPVRNL